MTEVYIVRHGATKLNNQTDMSEDRIRGWTDVPLADSGRVEARKAGLKLKSKGVQAIVSSDLSRAHETAQIIGKIVGVKPTATKGLRPWDLGAFAGCSTKDCLPKIAEYAQSKPDEPVPKGESFNQFKERAFAGLADALEAHPGKVLVIVTHHRDERLYEAWDRAGRREDLSIDMGTFLQKGDPPGGIKELKIGGEEWQPKPATPIAPAESGSRTKRENTIALRDGAATPANTDPLPKKSTSIPAAAAAGSNGPSMPNPSEIAAPSTGDQAAGEKLSHAEVKYGMAKPGGDRCATCEYFKGKDDCTLVEPPIYPAGWCNKFEAKDADPESEVMPSEPESTNPDTGPAPPQTARAVPPAFAHGRAIAGAKALHAVGHISAAERDKHVRASQKVISKRKAFGSWAP